MKNKKNIFYSVIAIMLFIVLHSSCNKDGLDLNNPNQPSSSATKTYSGALGLAKGMYKAGYNFNDLSPLDNYGGFSMFVMCYHEMMGDIMFMPWGNSAMRWVGSPKSYVMDDGSNVSRVAEASQAYSLKIRNSSAQASNAVVFEWLYMYKINSLANTLLASISSSAELSPSQLATFKAWAYWWKGLAYSRIGSMYIAGVINNTAGQVINKYQNNEKMITEAAVQFDNALAELNKISNTEEYNNLIQALIPQEFTNSDQGSLSVTAFKKNIYAYKARNILVNTRQQSLTSTQLNDIISYTSGDKALGKSDFHFYLATASDNVKTLIPQDWRSLQFVCTPSGGSGFISPRFVQDFDTTNDKRFKNNIVEDNDAAWYNIRSRGLCFGSKWFVRGGGIGNGAITYNPETNTTYSQDRIYIGVTYEEVVLMNAEANLLNGGSVADVASKIDVVKNFQGAGLGATSLSSLDEAKEELRKERRRALAFRGLGFYDARRLGILDDGKGRSKAWVFDGDGNLNTNVKINYAYMAYWDVPANELDNNPPSGDSDKIKTE